MGTYLNRYQSGECEAVWRELQALGAAVREEPVYSDAVAVAQETMRRTRANIETLVERLTKLGYRFGKKSLDYTPPVARESNLHGFLGSLLESPPANISEQIAALEAERGTLPISLRAFYEIVGTVDLRGYLPVPEEQWEHLEASATSEYGPVPETLDALMVFPLVEAAQQEGAERGKKTLYITPDPLAKMDISSVGWLAITLPCETIDAFVWLDTPYDSEEDLFVTSLRRAFRYGGFNHFSQPEYLYHGEDTAFLLRTLRTPDGESYLHFLTRDLLPI